MSAHRYDFYMDQMGSDDPALQDFIQGTSQDFDRDLTQLDEGDQFGTYYDNLFDEPFPTKNLPHPIVNKDSVDNTTHSAALLSIENFLIWEKQNAAQIAEVRRNIASLKEKVETQEAALILLEEEHRDKKEEYHAFLNRNNASNGVGDKDKKKKSGPGLIDYDNDRFLWDASLKDNMRKVFGINEFRLCQRGVCNANMDGRDIVVVMPTGGGKSLTYQLPAIMTAGVTLVLSPLVSLISDQIMHLENAGVEAVKFTGSTPKSDQDVINARLGNMAAGREMTGKDIKLVYCTPEKIAKSKKFVALLQKLADATKLARIVIDEAHCVSQLGHDFRPDYQKLHILRQLFPNVPIMALSATCPPLVLADLLKVLRLGATVPSNNVPRSKNPPKTIYFTSPLYRPNLHYQVLPKASESSKVYEEMTAWILEKHREHSGIVYCLSKKDTEKVAMELNKRGGIRTGVYHSDRSDSEKEKLHWNWQKGVVKVVCATIAFGLGIDKGDVRFVIHHSVSKSLDGYYQESGRAGRDGKDSDCVLYYRAQDASTLSSMAVADKDGIPKLHAILSFAQDLQKCRKIQFADYFSHTSNLAKSSWTTSSASVHDRCGHCDNCTRPAESLVNKDVTVEAWKLLRIVQEVARSKGNVTLSRTAELARSTGKGSYSGRGEGGAGGPGGRAGKRGRTSNGSKEQIIMDLDAVCGGRVDLRREDIETLIIDLLLNQYLKERYHNNSYTTVVYIQLGERAPKLLRFPNKEALATLSESMRLSCSFRLTKRNPKGRPKSTVTSSNKTKAKVRTSNLDNGQRENSDAPEISSDIDIREDDIDDVDDDEIDMLRSSMIAKRNSRASPVLLQNRARSKPAETTIISDDEDNIFEGDESEDVNDWMDIATTRPRKRPRTEQQQENEVIELSSDNDF